MDQVAGAGIVERARSTQQSFGLPPNVQLQTLLNAPRDKVMELRVADNSRFIPNEQHLDQMTSHIDRPIIELGGVGRHPRVAMQVELPLGPNGRINLGKLLFPFALQVLTSGSRKGRIANPGQVRRARGLRSWPRAATPRALRKRCIARSASVSPGAGSPMSALASNGMPAKPRTYAQASRSHRHGPSAHIAAGRPLESASSDGGCDRNAKAAVVRRPAWHMREGSGRLLGLLGA